ncbi:MAG: M24 family metallopeptidase [Candidatus Hodarchaeota archaeon]
MSKPKGQMERIIFAAKEADEPLIANFQAETPRDLLLSIIKEKHAQIPSIMEESAIDCWIIFVRETTANPDPVMNLIIGGDVVWDSAFIFSNTKENFSRTAIVGNFDADEEVKKAIWDEVIPYKEGISSSFQQFIDSLSPLQIALNYSQDDAMSDGLSHGMFLKLESILSNKRKSFVSASPIVSAIRSRKTSKEIALITKACELTEEINDRIAGQLQVGMTEKQIQRLFHNEMDRLGAAAAWQRNSCPSIDAGPEKTLGHVGPTTLKLQEGHTLHNDFGVKLNGYCSDLQRMWFVGSANEIPDELMHAFETVKNAIRLALAAIKPGCMGYKIDKIARDYVKERNYEEYAHALGHQVGRQAHDGGTLLGPLWERYGDLPRGEIEEGNVFTLELHVKTQNYGTVSLEENIVVTASGARFLVPPQEEFRLIK